MKKAKRFFRAFLCLFAFVFASNVAGISFAQTAPGFPAIPSPEKAEYIPGVLNVKIDPAQTQFCKLNAIEDAGLNARLSRMDVKSLKSRFPTIRKPAPLAAKTTANAPVDLTTIYQIELPEGANVFRAAALLQKHPMILWAEPEYYDYPMADPYEVNDPMASEQWWIQTIAADSAWSVSNGDTSVIVGIVDTGFDLDHPDLVNQVYLNYDDPINGLDDDNDGYIDNYRGWDFSGADANNPQQDNDPTVQAVGLHGAYTSGLAAAQTDNETGIASPAFNVKFLPVKVSPDNSNSLNTAYDGMIYAAEMGCQIINCSFGSTVRSLTRQEIINYITHTRNALILASSGNENSETVYYPASYENVLSVGSTGRNDRRSGNTVYNYYVDIVAPGGGFPMPDWDDRYRTESGGFTSISCGIASGAAALVKAVYPEYDWEQLGERLRVTCDDIYPLHDENHRGKLGGGRINLNKAVTKETPGLRVAEMTITDGNDNIPRAGELATVRLRFRNLLDEGRNLTATVSAENSTASLRNNIFNIGRLASLETSEEFALEVQISNDVEANERVWFRIDYEGDNGYASFENFSIVLNPEFYTISENNISATLNSTGNWGFNDFNTNQQGVGIRYKDNSSWLYEGALIVGAEPFKVSDAARNGPSTQEDDFMIALPVEPNPEPRLFDGEAHTVFGDDADGLNVLVEQIAGVFSGEGNENYVATEYRITNRSQNDYDELFIGLLADWDLESHLDDTSAFDPYLKLAYTHDGPRYAGVVLLNSDLSPALYNGDNTSLNFNNTDPEKYQAISGQLNAEPLSNTDVFQILSGGPIQLNSGEQQTIAFAIVLSESECGLKNAATAAISEYRTAKGKPTPSVLSFNEPALTIQEKTENYVGCEGYSDVLIDFALDRPLAENTVLRLKSQDLSAQAGRDYELLLNEVNLGRGSQSGLVVVRIFHDFETEAPEQFILNVEPENPAIVLPGCEDGKLVFTIEDAPQNHRFALQTNGPAGLCENPGLALTAPFPPTASFLWYKDGQIIPSESSRRLQPQTAGKYQALVTLGQDCRKFSEELIVKEGFAASLDIAVDPATCYQTDDGRIVVNASEETLEYDFAVNGEPRELERQTVLSGLAPGRYLLELRNETGCANRYDISVTEPAPLEANVFHNMTACPGCDNGYVIAHPKGGVPPFEIRLNGASPNVENTFRGLQAGEYSLLIEDDNGCEQTYNFTLKARE